MTLKRKKIKEISSFLIYIRNANDYIIYYFVDLSIRVIHDKVY
jgi:hypothetical protein